MNQQTLELLRALQSSDRDAKVFEQIRGLLASQRSHLTAEDDRATLADLSELLEVWAENAAPELAAEANASAAQIAEEDLGQAERAVQLYVLSLEQAPAAPEPLAKLDALLSRRGEHDRLESILSVQAKALRERTEVDPARAAAVLCRLGQLRAERGADVNAAIEAYEQALDLAADPDTIRALADLYAKRGATGDAVQSADLYCTLGDVMGAEGGGSAMLERALDQSPAHDAALDLLETYVPVGDQARVLKQRWASYIERSDNEVGTDKRRLLLARAHAAEGQYRDALICLGPLIDKGESEALRLQAAFLANLHENEAAPQTTKPADAAAAGAAAKTGNGKAAVKRPATLVGFRLPPGEGVPEVAEPPPEDADALSVDTGLNAIGEDEPEQFAASARNAFAARSGETLVGFRVPPIRPGGAPAPAQIAKGPEAPAAKRSEDATPTVVKSATPMQAKASERAFEERGSGERARDKTADAPAVSAKAAAAANAGASDANAEAKPARASSGTYAAAAARASGPAALSAALSSARATSPGTQRAAAAARNSVAGTRNSTPAIAARSSAPASESPAAKAAALKATRSSNPPPAVGMSSSPPAMRASSPPPLKRRSLGAAAAVVAPLPTANAAPAAFAATLPMPTQAQAPAPIATPAAVAATEHEPLAATHAAPVPAMRPRAQPLESGFITTARKRKLDPRWLAVSGVVTVAVIVGVIWSSGDDAAPPAADSAAPSTAASTAAAPTPAAAVAAAPTAAAQPTLTAAAPATPPAASTTSALAAAVATPTAAPAAPAPSAPRAPSAAPARSAKSKLAVKLGTVRVRGGTLAPKAIGSAFDDGLDQIERCYADAVERKPGLEGRATFAFNVEKTGKAAKVRKTSATIKDPALLRCSSEAIQKTRFPKPKKRAAQVTLPLEYSK